MKKIIISMGILLSTSAFSEIKTINHQNLKSFSVKTRIDRISYKDGYGDETDFDAVTTITMILKTGEKLTCEQSVDANSGDASPPALAAFEDPYIIKFSSILNDVITQDYTCTKDYAVINSENNCLFLTIPVHCP